MAQVPSATDLQVGVCTRSESISISISISPLKEAFKGNLRLPRLEPESLPQDASLQAIFQEWRAQEIM